MQSCSMHILIMQSYSCVNKFPRILANELDAVARAITAWDPRIGVGGFGATYP